MATHQISILGHGTVPDASSLVFFEPYSVDATTVLDPLILAFAFGTTKNGIRGEFTIPQNYVGTASFKVIWTAVETAGNAAVWDLSYLATGGTEDFDDAADDATDTVTSSKNTTSGSRTEATIAVTSADFAAGDQVTWEVFRDQTVGADTLAVKAQVFDILFQYDDA